MLGELHACPPGSCTRREDFAIPGRTELVAALAGGDRWNGGPYGERTRERVVAHAPRVRNLLAPRERDLWNLPATVPGPPPRPALLELYRSRWDLGEIA